MRLNTLLAVAVLSLGFSATSVHAADVYYTTGNVGAEIFAITVSEDKSVTTDVGPTNGGVCASLAMSKLGMMFSVCGPLFGAQQLATIDLNTGHATLFGAPTSGLAVMSLAFAPDGTLYAIGDCNPAPVTFECTAGTDPKYNSLYTVDVNSGAFTWVGATGAPQFFMDLAFDPHGNLYGVTTTLNPSHTPAVLYRIDRTTGAATKPVTLIGSSQLMGLAFGEDGALYATDFMSHPGLYRIDIKTGLQTAVAALPFALSSSLELVKSRDKD